MCIFCDIGTLSQKNRGFTLNPFDLFKFLWQAMCIFCELGPNAEQVKIGDGVGLADIRIAENCEKLRKGRVPICLVTGFLGSGKTTLINRILKEKHGYKIAVVENEFGDVSIDDDLLSGGVKDTTKDAEVVLMANGCMCCRVRGDLIKAIQGLLEPGVKDPTKKLDSIVIETSGLSEVAPVAQTFYADMYLQMHSQLDCVVTVVDAPHSLKVLSTASADVEQPKLVMKDPISLADMKKQIAQQQEDWMARRNEIAGDSPPGQPPRKRSRVAQSGGTSASNAAPSNANDIKETEPKTDAEGKNTDAVEEKEPPPERELLLEQIMLADRVLVNKSGLLESQEQQERLESLLHGANPSAGLVWCNYCAIDMGLITNTNAFKLDNAINGSSYFADEMTIENLKNDNHSHAAEFNFPFAFGKFEKKPVDVDHDDLHGTGPGQHEHKKRMHVHTLYKSIAFEESERPLILEKLQKFVAEILLEFPDLVVRYKGVLWAQHEDHRIIMQGVYCNVDWVQGEKWEFGEEKSSKVIFIGKGLADRKAELQKRFENCRAPQKTYFGAIQRMGPLL
jgi:G3E family GTPase